MPEYKKARDLVRKLQIEIKYNNNGRSAGCYNQTLDYIRMGKYSELKKSRDFFWAVMFHEIGHWSGHPKRVNRKSLVDRAKAAVGIASDEKSAERMQEYVQAIRQVFSGKDRYGGIERLMRVLGPYVGISVVLYSLYHLDDFRWGKTRTINEDDSKQK